jgi:hypothetical protein
MTGTLKARVGSAWVPILGAGQEAANLARWNTAWGRVGQSAVKATTLPAGAPQLACTDPLTVTLTSGRRYRIKVVFRAMACGNKNGSASFGLFDGGFNTGLFDGWISVANNYGGGTIENFYDGDGITHVYDVRGNGQSTDTTSPMVISAGAGSILYVEDVGPTVLASVAPPTAGPRVVASGNALGIVAMGALNTPNPVIAQNTYGNVTQDMSVFWAVGRRYRVVLSVRATSNAAYPSSFMCRLSLNPGSPTTEKWRSPSTSYEGGEFTWVYDGDGTTHVLSCQMSSQQGVLTVYTDYTGWFYCEDIGPNMSPALPIPETPPAWTALTPLQSGWVATTETPGYRKIGDIVSLRGCATITGPYSPNYPFATLPVGFRPPRLVRANFPAHKSNVGGAWMIRASIMPDGSIALSEYSNTADQANPNISLDNYQFSTTA